MFIIGVIFYFGWKYICCFIFCFYSMSIIIGLGSESESCSSFGAGRGFLLLAAADQAQDVAHLPLQLRVVVLAG